MFWCYSYSWVFDSPINGEVHEQLETLKLEGDNETYEINRLVPDVVRLCILLRFIYCFLVEIN